MTKFVHPVPVVLALGSNLGEREATLDAAIAALSGTPGITVIAVSRYHETVALTLDGRDMHAPAYVNAVVLVDTVLGPERLLDICNAIENAHGRVRKERWGARTLDIDIIDYDHIHLQTTRLTLPHPRAHERDFVLAPWLEVDADAEIPGIGPVRGALDALGAQGSVS